MTRSSGHKRQPKLIRYSSRLDRYNARHARARARGKKWAEQHAHDPYPNIPIAAVV